MTRNGWVSVAAVNGFISVGAGAFGAHALKSRLSADALSSFEVAVRYQMYHALALLAVAWVCAACPSRKATAAGWAMLVGIILFCGSIYGLTLAQWRWLGPVTPLGGLSFLVGWVLLGLSARGDAQRAPANDP